MKTFKITFEMAGETHIAHIKARNGYDAVRIYMQYFESAKLCEMIVSVEEEQ